MNQRFKSILMGSVAFNALLIGIVLGELSYSFSSYFVQDTTPYYHHELTPEEKLSADKRKLMESILHPAWHDVQIARGRIDEEKKKALAILKAQPFNEKAYRAQNQHVLDLHAEMKRNLLEAVIKVAKQFDPAEREVLAEIVARPVSYMAPEPK